LPTCNQKREITAVGRRKGQSKAERALQHPGGLTRKGYEGAPLAASKKQPHSPRIEDLLENAPAASSRRWPQTRWQSQLRTIPGAQQVTAEPEFLKISNDDWAESLISRLPNKSADIFNVKCKYSGIYLIFSF
jgi:hypothetical protein